MNHQCAGLVTTANRKQRNMRLLELIRQLSNRQRPSHIIIAFSKQIAASKNELKSCLFILYRKLSLVAVKYWKSTTWNFPKSKTYEYSEEFTVSSEMTGRCLLKRSHNYSSPWSSSTANTCCVYYVFIFPSFYLSTVSVILQIRFLRRWIQENSKTICSLSKQKQKQKRDKHYHFQLKWPCRCK